MCWLERSYDGYPALSEVILKLQGLPYELNKKRGPVSDVVSALQGELLEPVSRVALYHYRTLSTQHARIDNRRNLDSDNSDIKAISGGGSKDSGIRVTATYHVVSSTAQSDHSVGNFEYSFEGQKNLLNNRSKGMSAVPVEHDSLILHASTEIRNSRPAATGEYFALCFFMHSNE